LFHPRSFFAADAAPRRGELLHWFIPQDPEESRWGAQTEIEAKYVGIFQSLLVTCRLQGVDPYTCLVDVLQRVERHPAGDGARLTPRLWKEHFAADPPRSVIDRCTLDAVS